MPTPDVSVVVLAYGDEPLLPDCITAVRASTRPDGSPLDPELVVVDNGARHAVSSLSPSPRTRVLATEENLGFAGGCNAGAALASGQVLVFLNSDAIVEPNAVARLTEAASQESTGLVCGSVRLLADPALINSVGNPVHFLGVSWAGGYLDPASEHRDPCDVTSVTGAFFAVRREVWESLGGFADTYFAYHEDVELSLRTWQRGMRVRFEPSAAALHDYAFSRNPTKHYLLERNRWQTLLTVYPTAVLAVTLPALLAFELAVLAMATVQGWLPQKLRSYAWLLRHTRALRRRRRQVQVESQLSAARFADLLTPRIELTVLGRFPFLAVLNWALERYWRLARQVLPTSR